ncbi:hypothetical protein Ancab_034033 [Ancistrocladus abbreviatus]
MEKVGYEEGGRGGSGWQCHREEGEKENDGGSLDVCCSVAVEMTELCLFMSLFERGNSESEFRRRRVGELRSSRRWLPLWEMLWVQFGALPFCVRSGVATLPGPTAFKDFLGLARKSFGAVRLVSVSFVI